jgi:hypothetical protein
MINYSSTRTVQSRLPDFEGVSFTIRRISDGLRNQYRLETAGALREQADLIEQREDLVDAIRERMGMDEKAFSEVRMDQLPRSDRRTLREVGTKIDQLNSEAIYPAMIEVGLVSVDGLTIDGQPVDVDSLHRVGPESLVAEILFEIRKEFGLAVEAQENLGSPTTSGAAEGGKATDTAAVTA